ncbi:MAG: ribosome assembly cofactor RimP [Chlorobi bacterium]|nr:ribosome assembly cofactor RimP [Chlorobiota bacterium]
MYQKKDILKITEEIITSENNNFESTNIFLTDIKVSQDNKISILIDSFDGIKISDCIKLSKKIEEKLDREKEDFELVVSSAGLDKPFKVFKQYEKNKGKQIKILTKDGKKIKGTIISAENPNIEIQPETKKTKNKKSNKTKPETEKNINLNINEIKEAKVVITF